MNMRFQLERWEQVSVAAGGALFLASLVLYVRDYRFLSGSSHERGASIGAISSAQGSVQREFAAESTFTPVRQNQPVFDGDTVMTEPASSAVISLNGGTMLMLEPQTMIRLSFDSQLSLSGISRVARVNVVTGRVIGKPKAAVIRVQERGRTARTVEAGAELVQEAKLAPYVPPKPAPAEEIVPPPPPEILQAPPKAVPVGPARPLPVVTPAPKPTLLAERAQASPIPAVSAVPNAVPSVLPSAVPSPRRSTEIALKRVQILEPKPAAHLHVPDGSLVPSLTTSVKWQAKPPGIPVRVALYRISNPKDGEISREEIFTQPDTTSKRPLRASHKLDAPGDYEWEIQGPGGESLSSLGKTSVPFRVEREFTGVHSNDPLVGGKSAASNQLTDRVMHDFDIQLSWKPFPEAKSYRVWIAGSPTATKALLEKDLGGETKYQLNKGKVFKGRMYYRILAKLPSGFIATSPTKPLIFDFMPPRLGQPKQGSRVTKADLDAFDGELMFTWQHTNFTEEYLFELASDAAFQKVVHSERSEDNYLIIPLPSRGTFYWRVRSISKGIESAPSAPVSFSY
jgi:hypothetical protein